MVVCFRSLVGSMEIQPISQGSQGGELKIAQTLPACRKSLRDADPVREFLSSLGSQLT